MNPKLKRSTPSDCLCWVLLFVTSLLPSICGAAAPNSWELDFQDLFQGNYYVQSAGSCHIFAAASLYEAACFEATGGWRRNSAGEFVRGSKGEKVPDGKRIQISRAHLFYLHLLSKIQRANNVESLVAPRYAYENDKRYIFKFDGGLAFDDIGLIESNRLCSVTAFPFGKTFTEGLKDAQGIVAGYYAEEFKIDLLKGDDESVSLFQKKLELLGSQETAKIKRALLRDIKIAATSQLKAAGRYSSVDEIPNDPDLQIPKEIVGLKWFESTGDISPSEVVGIMRENRCPIIVSTTTYDELGNQDEGTKHAVVIAAIGRDSNGEWWALHLDSFDKSYRVARKLVNVRRVLYYTIAPQ